MLGFLHASARPGVELVIEAVGLVDRLRGAHVVITGEGRIDRQSLRGKAPLGVARLAAQHDVPVIAIGGIDAENVGEVLAAGAWGVAVLSAIVAHADPRAATARLRERIDRSIACGVTV